MTSQCLVLRSMQPKKAKNRSRSCKTQRSPWKMTQPWTRFSSSTYYHHRRVGILLAIMKPSFAPHSYYIYARIYRRKLRSSSSYIRTRIPIPVYSSHGGYLQLLPAETSSSSSSSSSNSSNSNSSGSNSSSLDFSLFGRSNNLSSTYILVYTRTTSSLYAN